MGHPALTSREHLELLRSSAFESEHAWLYDNSYLQHEAAALALEQEIEQSHASISPDDNSDEQVRILKTQINIHRERQRALRPHLESGSDQIDEEGNECVFVPAPNQWGANGDLDEESESLSAIHNLLTWQTSYSPVSHAPHDELPSPDIPYHSLLDPTQPTTTYNLHRTREWTGSSGFRKYIYSARDYSNKYALYMLEATHRDDSQVNAADFFRVAEFPQPCISILLSGIDKKRMATKDAAYKSRSIHLKGPFSQPISEYPDRQHKIPWSPRRFKYGGRRFVWKQGDPNDDAMPETLYEYQQDWMKPGSRTGKRCDDAKPIKLVWGEKRRKGKVDSYTIHFRGGMDQVFREILLASQMARQYLGSGQQAYLLPRTHSEPKGNVDQFKTLILLRYCNASSAPRAATAGSRCDYWATALLTSSYHPDYHRSRTLFRTHLPRWAVLHIPETSDPSLSVPYQTSSTWQSNAPKLESYARLSLTPIVPQQNRQPVSSSSPHGTAARYPKRRLRASNHTLERVKVQVDLPTSTQRYHLHRLLRQPPTLPYPLHRLPRFLPEKDPPVMSSTRNTALRETTHSFCRALISPPPPSDLLLQYFSNAPKITEHGPEWSRSRLPFLAKTFSGRDGCEEYFKVMTDVLDMSLPEDAFPGKEGFIVDAEAGMVSVVGKGRFTSRKTGKGWNEQFIYRFSGFDEQGKIGHWEVWADPLSAWNAVGE
ncbi:hypothetical protein GT037_006811 [Alternaria burnsii]|uniref:Uncharacterized protein n=2 Tax=Alternaria sect. Alternaria TaxID=2499237 RepID=A0A8H7B488_9PLEO|nr:uncharacterized protein GT037_006811 [Alternaria burnsii]KAF7675048.1 hypothetical protein GT037_006811 [Alternaria burnsii]